MKYNGTTIPTTRDNTYDASEVHRKSSNELYETAFNDDQKTALPSKFSQGGSGGGGYDAVIVLSVDEEEQPIITIESGSFSDFYSKFENGDRPSIQVIIDNFGDGYSYYSVNSILDDGDGGLLINVHSTNVAAGSTEPVCSGLQFVWTLSGIEVGV